MIELDYNDVRSWLQAHANDERINPTLRSSSGVTCRYTDEDDLDRHCIAGQYLTERDLPLPMEGGNLTMDYKGKGESLLTAAQFVADGRGLAVLTRSSGDAAWQFFPEDFPCNDGKDGTDYWQAKPRVWKDAIALLDLTIPEEQVQ